MSDTLTNLLAELSAKEAEARALIDKPDATADEVNAIRDELKRAGIQIEDTPSGTVWRRALA